MGDDAHVTEKNPDEFDEVIMPGAFAHQAGKEVPLTIGGLGGPRIGTAKINADGTFVAQVDEFMEENDEVLRRLAMTKPDQLSIERAEQAQLPGAGLTQRGFVTYTEFEDGRGTTIRVAESSSAEGRHVWIFAGAGAAHLSEDEAATVRDALGQFVRGHDPDHTERDTDDVT
jgi:hypothetical protein